MVSRLRSCSVAPGFVHVSPDVAQPSSAAPRRSVTIDTISRYLMHGSLAARRATHQRPGREHRGAGTGTTEAAELLSAAYALRGRNGHIHRLAVAIHEHHDRRVLGLLVEPRLEVLDRTDRPAVDLDDHVTGADAGFGRAAALDHVTDQHALFDLEPELARYRRRHRLHRAAELALAVGLRGGLGVRLVLELGDVSVQALLLAFPHHHHRHILPDR